MKPSFAAPRLTAPTVAVLLAGAALLGHLSQGAPVVAQSTPPGRNFTELQNDIRATLRREAESKTVADRTSAIYQLVDLHREIVRDPRFSASETLQGYRRQVAGRLVKIQDDLKRDARKRTGTVERRANYAAAVQLLAEHIELVGATTGGPARLLAIGDANDGSGNGATDTTATSGKNDNGGSRGIGRAAGGGLVPDNGLGLVDLIQKTIHPDFWDVQGGPGSIVYFSPLRCLVVRATDDVHGDVGGLLDGLRRAGE